mgnify:CR=1 FL=1
MTQTADDRITARQFHDSDGVEDWRFILRTVQTLFRTGSFTAGVELVDAIGALAEAANPHPDVELRYGTVTVRRPSGAASSTVSDPNGRSPTSEMPP